jgi:hypothetical protein
LEFDNYIQTEIDVLSVKTVLDSDYPYFKSLSPVLQKRFIERTIRFIEEKKYVGRQNLIISNRIRVVVAACAVQVTFGLDSYLLETFEYVVIYPDVYESPVTGKWHKGETNLNGFICLSWKHILEGIQIGNDNYNLGLHEWTHALRFNSIKFEETDYFFDGYINKWVANAMFEFNKLRLGKESIFRRYGATNIHEFLSVCIEHFFESPDDFKEHAPQLFKETCILLNQDPTSDRGAGLFVRNKLLQVNNPVNEFSAPKMILEASFFRTLINFGPRLIYFGALLFVLLAQANGVTTTLAFFLCLLGVVVMNNKYFTLEFYDDHVVYLQKGFIDALATKMSVNYFSLIKLEIFDGNYDGSLGTVFEFKYYDGTQFIKKTAYCSAIDVPSQEIKKLLQEKNVAVLTELNHF